MTYFQKIVSRNSYETVNSLGPSSKKEGSPLADPFEPAASMEVKKTANGIFPSSFDRKDNADKDSARNAQEVAKRVERPDSVQSVAPPVQTILERVTVRDRQDYVEQTQYPDSGIDSFPLDEVIVNKSGPAPDGNDAVTQKQKHQQLNATMSKPADITQVRAFQVEKLSKRQLLQPVQAAIQPTKPKEKDKESPKLLIGKMIVEIVTEQKKPDSTRKSNSVSSKNNFTARRNPLSYGLGQL
jgi:hypothetical protein